MLKYVLISVVAAIVVATSNPAAAMTARVTGAEIPRRQYGEVVPGQNLDNVGARKRGGLASACCCITYEPWLLYSGGQGIRTLNRLPGT